jgi:hypothetical protein
MVIFCVLLLAQIIRSVRKEHIRVEYSMAWFAAIVGLLILTLWGGALDQLADWFGIQNFSELLLLLAGLAFLFTFFRSSIELSSLKDHSIQAGQKIGLLEWEIRKQRAHIEELQNRLAEHTGPSSRGEDNV